MNIQVMETGGVPVAVLMGDEIVLTDEQSALDLLATVQYETGTNRIAIDKAAVAEDFFVLRTGIAGAILQKFINYDVKCAIIGDFSNVTSKALRDFIYESNQGKDIFFVATLEEAVMRLSK